MYIERIVARPSSCVLWSPAKVAEQNWGLATTLNHSPPTAALFFLSPLFVGRVRAVWVCAGDVILERRGSASTASRRGVEERVA